MHCPGLDIPALVCTGSADPWSDPAVTAEIIACLKRPEPVVIEGAGHLPNLEAEDDFNDILRAFLRPTHQAETHAHQRRQVLLPPAAHA